MADCPYCDELHPRGAAECPGHRIGTVVAGKYEIASFIGMGGMGAVYAARHLALDRQVALKMIHLQYAGDRELSARFVREARELAALGHPGIVDVRDSGVAEDGCAYIEMERLDGQDLHVLIQQSGALAVDRTVAIAVDVLDALAAIHARGVVHRDLKSGNIFLARDGAGGEQVKILDFGFAKANDAMDLTQPGEVLGSPLFISPEQYRDSAQVDARADLFSMGVILYQMLTGGFPYTASRRKEILKQVLLGQMQRSVRERRPEVPAWLDGVVERATAYERDDRYASALAMKQALEEGSGAAAGAAKPSLLRRLFGRRSPA